MGALSVMLCSNLVGFSTVLWDVVLGCAAISSKPASQPAAKRQEQPEATYQKPASTSRNSHD